MKDRDFSIETYKDVAIESMSSNILFEVLHVVGIESNQLIKFMSVQDIRYAASCCKLLNRKIFKPLKLNGTMRKLCKYWSRCIDSFHYFLFDEIDGYFKDNDFKQFISNLMLNGFDMYCLLSSCLHNYVGSDAWLKSQEFKDYGIDDLRKCVDFVLKSSLDLKKYIHGLEAMISYDNEFKFRYCKISLNICKSNFLSIESKKSKNNISSIKDYISSFDQNNIKEITLSFVESLFLDRKVSVGIEPICILFHRVYAEDANELFSETIAKKCDKHYSKESNQLYFENVNQRVFVDFNAPKEPKNEKEYLEDSVDDRVSRGKRVVNTDKRSRTTPQIGDTHKQLDSLPYVGK